MEADWVDGEEPDRERISEGRLQRVVTEKGTRLAVRRFEPLPQPGHQVAVYFGQGVPLTGKSQRERSLNLILCLP